MILYQPPDGYRYNSDSIFLYDFIARFSPKGRVLDVGCGVGILGALIARDWPVQMHLIDKQPEMIAYAKRNGTINGLAMETHTIDFADYAPSEPFEMIVSNPPFYDPAVTQSTHTHLNAARYAHHLPLQELIGGVKRLLRPRGYFLFVYDAKQIDAVLGQLSEAHLNPEAIRFVHPKADRDAKVAFVAARSQSRSMLKVWPPLIVFDARSRYRSEAQAAFRRADLHSITGAQSG